MFCFFNGKKERLKTGLAFALTALMMLSLTSCGSKAANNDIPKQGAAAGSTVQQKPSQENKEPAGSSNNAAAQGSYILEPITPQIPDSVCTIGDGMIKVKYNEEYGFLGPDGKVAIEPQFKYATDFYNGHAVVCKASADSTTTYTVIDKTGAELFSVDVKGIVNYMDDILWKNKFLFPMKEGYQLYNLSGEPCFDMPVNASLISSRESEYLVFIQGQDTKLLTVTDDTGMPLFQPINTAVNLNELTYEIAYKDGVLNAPMEDGQWNALDASGNKLLPKNFEKLKCVGEGLMPFLEYGKWGYVDLSGTVVIQPSYENAYPFSEGLAAVVVGGKMGFIDSSGKMVIEPQFSSEQSGIDYVPNKYIFKDGLAPVLESKGYGGIIDKKGNYVSKAQSISNMFYDGTGIVSYFYKPSSDLFLLKSKN